MKNHQVDLRQYQFYLFILCILLSSCGGGSQTESESLSSKGGLESYSFDITGESIPFAELIDNVEITRLEETEESLLGYVRQVYFVGNKMVIPGTDGNINVFGKNGSFMSRINRKGEGPEEYSGWNDIWLEGDTLAIYNYRRSINRYDLNGKFVSREPMEEQAAHVHPFGSGYVLDMNFRMTKDTMMYSVVVLDDQMTIDKTFLPFDEVPNFWVSMSNKTVFPSGNDLLYFPMMSKTVYSVEEDTVKPYIHYDFGEDWYLQPGVELTDAIMEDSGKNGQVWFITNKIGQNKIYLTGGIGMGISENFLIDRGSQRVTKIDFENETEEDYQLSPISWLGNELLASLQSSQIAELLEELDADQYSYTEGTTLEEIESSENPVLIKIKLKDK